MKNNQKHKVIGNITLFTALIFTLLFTFMLAIPQNSSFALDTRASSKAYTKVTDDLTKDENFNISNYPINNEDYSLKVIQIAESEDKDLFVYVYQPCTTKDFRASNISISQAINDNAKYVLHNLTYLNSEDTLYKYKVENIEIKQDALRYYDIPEIFRPFDSEIDEEAENGNTISEVSFEVAQLWSAVTLQGKVSYNCVTTEVIKITDKFVGFVRYPNGFSLMPSSCDAHFVAFNTDKPIDKLLEADLSYTSQTYRYKKYVGGNGSYTFGSVEEIPDTITYNQEGSNIGNGINAGKYNWPRISSIEDFKKSVNYSETYNAGIISVGINSTLSESGAKALEEKQWVLRFKETEYIKTYKSGGAPYHQQEGTTISDVTILRLKFELDGETYNLGVVDNKQSGSKDPINDVVTKVTSPIADFFVTVFKAIVKVIKTIFNFIVKFIQSLPLIVQILIYIILGLLALFILYWIIKVIVSLVNGIASLFKKNKK